MIEFRIVKRRRKIKVKRKRNGRVIIQTHLFVSFDDISPLLQEKLSPEQMLEAERLWRDDECLRYFKRGMLSVRLREKNY